MDFKLLYGYIFSSFAGLYLFFFFMAGYRFLRTRDIDSLKLACLTLCAAMLATSPVFVFATDNLSHNLLIYVFSAFCNYTAVYMYITLIAKRFNYKGPIMAGLSIAILIVCVTILTILFLCINGHQDLIFYFTKELPDNYFLIQAFRGARLTPFAQVISIAGTTLVLVTNLFLLFKFIKDDLDGYQKLVILGVVTSLLAKTNDFFMTAGVGYYLVPMGFLGYFFEILYFQFATVGKRN